MDEHLRELERRWKESGAIDDEVSFLQERLRVGDLIKERLELAAYCGHEAASLALEDKLSNEDSTLSEWAEMLELWGKECIVRAIVEVANMSLGTFEATFPDDERPRKAIEAASEWLDCQCEEHELAAADAEQPSSDAFMRASGGVGEEGAEIATQAARAAAYDADTSIQALTNAVQTACKLFPSDQLRQGVSQAITSWALG